ncbi:MAG: DUF3592 domain-containing protein [Pseudomonadota bacterium]
MFTIVSILASIMLLVLGAWSWRMSRRAAAWPSTQGIIVESLIDGVDTEDQRPKVCYHYSVAGQHLKGWRISYSAYGSSRGAMERFIAPYLRGASVTVYYDPDLPARSVLSNRPAKDWIFCFAAALGFAVLAGYLAGL